MTIDLHIHTIVSSFCSFIDPEELVRVAMEMGLDGICVAEHGALEGARVVKEIGRREGLPVFEGMEVMAREGHLLVYGYPDSMPETLPAKEVIERVEAAGGIVVPAHPYRSPFGWYSGELKQPLEDTEFAKMFSVIEMFNGLSTREENRRCEKLCEAVGLFGTGGSDAHRIQQVGCCVTVFDEDIEDERHLVKELKKGRYHAKMNENYDL